MLCKPQYWQPLTMIAKHWMKQLIIIILILLSCTACRQKGRQHVLLRLKYQKGDVFDIRYQTYITAESETEPIKNEYVRMTFKVDSVLQNGEYLLSAKYVYVRVDNNKGLIRQSYSSDQDENAMSQSERAIHENFKAIRDSVFTLTVNNRGQLKKPMAFAGGRPIPTAFAPIDFENCQIVFPKDSIVTGDEWINERISPDTKNRRSYTYTLYSIKEGTMEVGVKGEFEQAGSGETHAFTGEYTIKREDQNLVSGNIEMSGNAASYGKVKIGIVINGPR
jgi:hypothetical protein